MGNIAQERNNDVNNKQEKNILQVSFSKSKSKLRFDFEVRHKQTNKQKLAQL